MAVGKPGAIAPPPVATLSSRSGNKFRPQGKQPLAALTHARQSHSVQMRKEGNEINVMGHLRFLLSLQSNLLLPPNIFPSAAAHALYLSNFAI